MANRAVLWCCFQMLHASPHAQEGFYKAVGSIALGVARRWRVPRGEWDDLAQDAEVRAFKVFSGSPSTDRLPHFEDEHGLYSYVRTIAVRLASDSLRRNGRWLRRSGAAPQDSDEDTPDTSPDAIDVIVGKEFLARPDVQKFLTELSELPEVRELSEGARRVRKSRARSKLYKIAGVSRGSSHRRRRREAK